MKPVDKKDRPKLILMICLSVCCFAYGIVTLATDPALKPVPPAKAEEKEVAEEKPGDAPATPAGPDTFSDSLKALEGVNEPVLVRDPFLAQGVVAVVPSTPPPTAPTVSKVDTALVNLSLRAQSLRKVLGLEVNLPDNKDNPSKGSSTGQAPTRPLELPPPAAPVLKVTGILVAEGNQGKSHAIVRINDETRWLSVGERLGQGFVVQSIRRTDSGSELEIVDSNNTQRRFIFKVN